MACRRVAVSLRGPGQSPVLPFACCVGSLRSDGRCGRCALWRGFRVGGAQWLAHWGLCRLLRGSFSGPCCALPSAFRSPTACLTVSVGTRSSLRMLRLRPVLLLVSLAPPKKNMTTARGRFSSFQRGGGGAGCIRREGTSEVVPEAVGQAVGGGCQSGWGRVLSVANDIEPGTCRQGDSGWA